MTVSFPEKNALKTRFYTHSQYRPIGVTAYIDCCLLRLPSLFSTLNIPSNKPRKALTNEDDENEVIAANLAEDVCIE